MSVEPAGAGALMKRLALRIMGERLYVYLGSSVRRLLHAALAANPLRRGAAVPPVIRPDLLPLLHEKWLPGEALPELAADSPLRAYLERRTGNSAAHGLR